MAMCMQRQQQIAEHRRMHYNIVVDSANEAERPPNANVKTNPLSRLLATTADRLDVAQFWYIFSDWRAFYS